ncbi:hypothetical protein BLNAU_14089 [Blattamonas nauphoetae]|uniref:RING-type domain-containing protein n=1 Tax=Blattamonas nauphoetae TaxID=2049346 RepID=A0ABQ9XL85_9EUKA|nr:hypothetical protein BLNAU_14089 [Blattamonas nauphoetae]
MDCFRRIAPPVKDETSWFDQCQQGTTEQPFTEDHHSMATTHSSTYSLIDLGLPTLFTLKLQQTDQQCPGCLSSETLKASAKECLNCRRPFCQNCFSLAKKLTGIQTKQVCPSCAIDNAFGNEKYTRFVDVSLLASILDILEGQPTPEVSINCISAILFIFKYLLTSLYQDGIRTFDVDQLPLFLHSYLNICGTQLHCVQQTKLNDFYFSLLAMLFESFGPQSIPVIYSNIPVASCLICGTLPLSQDDSIDNYSEMSPFQTPLSITRLTKHFGRIALKIAPDKPTIPSPQNLKKLYARIIVFLSRTIVSSANRVFDVAIKANKDKQASTLHFSVLVLSLSLLSLLLSHSSQMLLDSFLEQNKSSSLFDTLVDILLSFLHTRRSTSPTSVPFCPDLSLDLESFYLQQLSTSTTISQGSLPFLTACPAALLKPYLSVSSFLHVHSLMIFSSLIHPSIQLHHSFAKKGRSFLSKTNELITLHTHKDHTTPLSSPGNPNFSPTPVTPDQKEDRPPPFEEKSPMTPVRPAALETVEDRRNPPPTLLFPPSSAPDDQVRTTTHVRSLYESSSEILHVESSPDMYSPNKDGSFDPISAFGEAIADGDTPPASPSLIPTHPPATLIRRPTFSARFGQKSTMDMLPLQAPRKSLQNVWSMEGVIAAARLSPTALSEDDSDEEWMDRAEWQKKKRLGLFSQPDAITLRNEKRGQLATPHPSLLLNCDLPTFNETMLMEEKNQKQPQPNSEDSVRLPQSSTLLISLIIPTLFVKILEMSKSPTLPSSLISLLSHFFTTIEPVLTVSASTSFFARAVCYASVKNSAKGRSISFSSQLVDSNNTNSPTSHPRTPLISTRSPIQQRSPRVGNRRQDSAYVTSPTPSHQFRTITFSGAEDSPPLTVNTPPTQRSAFPQSVRGFLAHLNANSSPLASHRQLPNFTVSLMSDSTDNLHSLLKQQAGQSFSSTPRGNEWTEPFSNNMSSRELLQSSTASFPALGTPHNESPFGLFGPTLPQLNQIAEENQIASSSVSIDMLRSIIFAFETIVSVLQKKGCFRDPQLSVMVGQFGLSPFSQVSMISKRFVSFFLLEDIRLFMSFTTKEDVEQLQKILKLTAAFEAHVEKLDDQKLTRILSQPETVLGNLMPDLSDKKHNEGTIDLALFSIFKFNHEHIPLLARAKKLSFSSLAHDTLAVFNPSIRNYIRLRKQNSFATIGMAIAFLGNMLQHVITLVDVLSQPIVGDTVLEAFNHNYLAFNRTLSYPHTSPFFWSAVTVDLIGFSQLHDCYGITVDAIESTGSIFTPIHIFRATEPTEEELGELELIATQAAVSANTILEHLPSNIPVPESVLFKWKGENIKVVPSLFLSTVLPYLRRFIHAGLMREEEFVIQSKLDEGPQNDDPFADPPPAQQPKPLFLTFCSPNKIVSSEYCQLYLNVMLYGLTTKEQLSFIVECILRIVPSSEAVRHPPKVCTSVQPHPFHPPMLIILALNKLAELLAESEHIRCFFLKEIPHSLPTVAQYSSFNKKVENDISMSKWLSDEDVFYDDEADESMSEDQQDIDRRMGKLPDENPSLFPDDNEEMREAEDCDENLQNAVGHVFDTFFSAHDEQLDPDRLCIKWAGIMIDGLWELYAQEPYPPPPSKVLIRRPRQTNQAGQAEGGDQTEAGRNGQATERSNHQTNQPHSTSAGPPNATTQPVHQRTYYTPVTVDKAVFYPPLGHEFVLHATLRALLIYSHTHPPDKYSVSWIPIFTNLFVPSKVHNMPIRDQTLLSFFLRLYLVTTEPPTIRDYTGYGQLLQSDSVHLQANLAEYFVEALATRPARSFNPTSSPIVPMKSEYCQQSNSRHLTRNVLETTPEEIDQAFVIEEIKLKFYMGMIPELMGQHLHSPYIEMQTLASDFFVLFLASMYQEHAHLSSPIEAGGIVYTNTYEVVALASQGFVYRSFYRMLQESIEQMKTVQRELNNYGHYELSPRTLKQKLKGGKSLSAKEGYVSFFYGNPKFTPHARAPSRNRLTTQRSLVARNFSLVDTFPPSATPPSIPVPISLRSLTPNLLAQKQPQSDLSYHLLLRLTANAVSFFAMTAELGYGGDRAQYDDLIDLLSQALIFRFPVRLHAIDALGYLARSRSAVQHKVRDLGALTAVFKIVQSSGKKLFEIISDSQNGFDLDKSASLMNKTIEVFPRFPQQKEEEMTPFAFFHSTLPPMAAQSRSDLPRNQAKLFDIYSITIAESLRMLYYSISNNDASISFVLSEQAEMDGTTLLSFLRLFLSSFKSVLPHTTKEVGLAEEIRSRQKTQRRLYKDQIKDVKGTMTPHANAGKEARSPLLSYTFSSEELEMVDNPDSPHLVQRPRRSPYALLKLKHKSPLSNSFIQSSGENRDPYSQLEGINEDSDSDDDTISEIPFSTTLPRSGTQTPSQYAKMHPSFKLSLVRKHSLTNFSSPLTQSKHVKMSSHRISKLSRNSSIVIAPIAKVPQSESPPLLDDFDDLTQPASSLFTQTTTEQPAIYQLDTNSHKHLLDNAAVQTALVYSIKLIDAMISKQTIAIITKSDVLQLIPLFALQCPVARIKRAAVRLLVKLTVILTATNTLNDGISTHRSPFFEVLNGARLVYIQLKQTSEHLFSFPSYYYPHPVSVEDCHAPHNLLESLQDTLSPTAPILFNEHTFIYPLLAAGAPPEAEDGDATPLKLRLTDFCYLLMEMTKLAEEFATDTPTAPTDETDDLISEFEEPLFNTLTTLSYQLYLSPEYTTLFAAPFKLPDEPSSEKSYTGLAILLTILETSHLTERLACATGSLVVRLLAASPTIRSYALLTAQPSPLGRLYNLANVTNRYRAKVNTGLIDVETPTLRHFFSELAVPLEDGSMPPDDLSQFGTHYHKPELAFLTMFYGLTAITVMMGSAIHNRRTDWRKTPDDREIYRLLRLLLQADKFNGMIFQLLSVPTMDNRREMMKNRILTDRDVSQAVIFKEWNATVLLERERAAIEADFAKKRAAANPPKDSDGAPAVGITAAVSAATNVSELPPIQPASHVIFKPKTYRLYFRRHVFRMTSYSLYRSFHANSLSSALPNLSLHPSFAAHKQTYSLDAPFERDYRSYSILSCVRVAEQLARGSQLPYTPYATDSVVAQFLLLGMASDDTQLAYLSAFTIGALCQQDPAASLRFIASATFIPALFALIRCSMYEETNELSVQHANVALFLIHAASIASPHELLKGLISISPLLPPAESSPDTLSAHILPQSQSVISSILLLAGSPVIRTTSIKIALQVVLRLLLSSPSPACAARLCVSQEAIDSTPNQEWHNARAFDDLECFVLVLTECERKDVAKHALDFLFVIRLLRTQSSHEWCGCQWCSKEDGNIVEVWRDTTSNAKFCPPALEAFGFNSPLSLSAHRFADESLTINDKAFILLQHTGSWVGFQSTVYPDFSGGGCPTVGEAQKETNSLVSPYDVFRENIPPHVKRLLRRKPLSVEPDLNPHFGSSQPIIRLTTNTISVENDEDAINEQFEGSFPPSPKELGSITSMATPSNRHQSALVNPPFFSSTLLPSPTIKSSLQKGTVCKNCRHPSPISIIPVEPVNIRNTAIYTYTQPTLSSEALQKRICELYQPTQVKALLQTDDVSDRSTLAYRFACYSDFLVQWKTDSGSLRKHIKDADTLLLAILNQMEKDCFEREAARMYTNVLLPSVAPLISNGMKLLFDIFSMPETPIYARILCLRVILSTIEGENSILRGYALSNPDSSSNTGGSVTIGAEDKPACVAEDIPYRSWTHLIQVRISETLMSRLIAAFSFTDAQTFFHTTTPIDRYHADLIRCMAVTIIDKLTEKGVGIEMMKEDNGIPALLPILLSEQIPSYEPILTEDQLDAEMTMPLDFFDSDDTISEPAPKEETHSLSAESDRPPLPVMEAITSALWIIAHCSKNDITMSEMLGGDDMVLVIMRVLSFSFAHSSPPPRLIAAACCTLSNLMEGNPNNQRRFMEGGNGIQVLASLLHHPLDLIALFHIFSCFYRLLSSLPESLSFFHLCDIPRHTLALIRQLSSDLILISSQYTPSTPHLPLSIFTNPSDLPPIIIPSPTLTASSLYLSISLEAGIQKPPRYVVGRDGEIRNQLWDDQILSSFSRRISALSNLSRDEFSRPASRTISRRGSRLLITQKHRYADLDFKTSESVLFTESRTHGTGFGVLFVDDTLDWDEGSDEIYAEQGRRLEEDWSAAYDEEEAMNKLSEQEPNEHARTLTDEVAVEMFTIPLRAPPHPTSTFVLPLPSALASLCTRLLLLTIPSFLQTDLTVTLQKPFFSLDSINGLPPVHTSASTQTHTVIHSTLRLSDMCLSTPSPLEGFGSRMAHHRVAQRPPSKR